MSRKVIVIICSIAVLAAIIVGFGIRRFHLLANQPVELSSLNTSIVERGMVTDMFEGEGIVEPQSEVLILSPTSTIIKSIEKAPGSRVSAYETILQLDPGPLADEISRMEDQLEVMRNNLHRNRLNARSTNVDLDYNVEMKKLSITSLKSEIADQKELLEVGGISPARFDQTRQELTLAEKELEMILSKNSIRLEQLAAEEKGLVLQIEMQIKELSQRRVDSSNTTVRAPSAGIILAISAKEGEKINRDQLLVRMSDLSSFKIRGSVDEEHADLLNTGQTVYAVLEREKLTGQIGNINPEIQNDKITFDVYLEEGDHPMLRPNLQVPLQVVSLMKQDVLRLPSGPALEKGNNVEVYVLEGNKAMLRKVSLGMMGPEYVEVLSGVDSGEKVVLSDISTFRNRPEIEFINP